VVFTLVDTASAKVQHHVSSPLNQHIEGLLNGTRNGSLSTVTSSGETQMARPPVSDEGELPLNTEETSKNLSIMEDAVDDKVFKEKDKQYIVRAEPKIIEMKPQVHAEKLEDMPEERVPANVSGTVTVTDDSVKDANVGKRSNSELTSTEGSEQVVPSEDIPSFSEWAQKQLAEAEKKKSECFTFVCFTCVKSLCCLSRSRVGIFCICCQCQGSLLRVFLHV
jgi:hypothetical protein